ncbi:hypothetical protein CMI47_16585 [Candidatus Pacearchaeota archaeon]|nr:hypothetical protein [Candidatus Pacearchaeota archaeon]
MSISTRVLPSSIESEQALIGCILNDNEQIDKVMHLIPEDDVFYNKVCRLLWGIMFRLRSEGKHIDLITLSSEIPDKYKNGGNVNIVYEMSGFPDIPPSPTTAPSYAKTLYEKWLMRNLIKKSRMIEDAANNPSESAIAKLEELYNSIGDALNLQTSDYFNLDTLLDDTIKNIYDKNNVIPSGITALDNIICGFTRGEISIIAGRPGHFKSTMMINIVGNLVKKGFKVLVMNREMSNVEMMKKIIVMESRNINYDTIRSGNYNDDEEDDVITTIKYISNEYKNLIMYDNIMDLAGAMREIRKHKPDIIVDDYIGLINVKGIDDNRLKIDTIMKQYKWAAKNNNMVCILLSQLNRKCEERNNKRPLPSDLRESGSIEQDAEMILFMYYEWRYLNQKSTLGEYGLEVVIGKNRYGKTGNLNIGVSGSKCKMYADSDIALASTIIKEK